MDIDRNDIDRNNIQNINWTILDLRCNILTFADKAN